MRRVTKKDFEENWIELTESLIACGKHPVTLNKLKKDPALYRQEFEYWQDSLEKDGRAIAIQETGYLYWKEAK